MGIINSTLEVYPPLRNSLTVKFFGYKRLIYGITYHKNGFLLKLNDLFLDRIDLFKKIFPILYKCMLDKTKVDEVKRNLRPFLREIEETIYFNRYRNYSSIGKFFNLEELSEEFLEDFKMYGVKYIFWSKRRAKKKLGYADIKNGVIVISKIFDSESVPDFVIKTLIYHELLHFMLPPKKYGKRVIHHSKNFREFEEKYEFYNDTLKFLDNYLKF